MFWIYYYRDMKNKINLFFISLIAVLPIGCKPKYVYCHFDEAELLDGPIHIRALKYEKIDNGITVLYRFTLESNEQDPTLLAENCTLFYETYCPVCEEIIKIDVK